MKLHWENPKGSEPQTTEALAALVRAEGRLGTEWYLDADTGLRCFWGVVENWMVVKGDRTRSRMLEGEDAATLWQAGLDAADNDAFQGTPEQRAEWAARVLESL